MQRGRLTLVAAALVPILASASCYEERTIPDDGEAAMPDGAGAGAAGREPEPPQAGASFADTGAPDDMQPDPSLPAPRLTCAELALERSSVPQDSCVPLFMTCTCDPPVYYPHWDAELGCVSALNCAALCELPVDQAFPCFERAPCGSDADCDLGRCARIGEEAPGECTSGADGEPCAEDDDCLSAGNCVAVDAAGRHVCSSGVDGTRCNVDEECGSLLCASPESAIDGECSDGASGRICYGAADCAGPARCVIAPAMPSGFCTVGDIGDHCVEHGDCRSAHCIIDSAQPRCTEGQAGHPCATDRDCVSGYCVPERDPSPYIATCADGELFTRCASDNDCASGRCVPAYGCAPSGGSGNPCRSDAECDSGVCTAHDQSPGVCVTQDRDPDAGGPEPAADGETCTVDADCAGGQCAGILRDGDRGLCTDGQEKSWCSRDYDCNSTFCATGSADEGVCTNATSGSPCFEDGECLGLSCVPDDGGNSPTGFVCA